MKEFLQTIVDEVNEIFDHNIETTKAYAVPSRDDAGLTFGKNQVKRGKLIETCVLFIDIRNSTVISRNLKKDKAKLGKLYSAFIHAMVIIADRYGYVRNIIGDRVMVVFEPNGCFTNAVECAATMYTTSYAILKKYSGIETFKVGIGIEHGEMLVLKSGIAKQHEEQSEYKNLVWVGDAANTASKLTDFANKEYNAPSFKVTYEYFENVRTVNPNPIYKDFIEKYLALPQYENKFEKRTNTISLNSQDYLTKVIWDHEGCKYEGKKVINIAKEERSGAASAVLMSGKVFREFKAANPKSPLLAFLGERSYPTQPYTGSGVYGGNPNWREDVKALKF